MKQSDVAKRLRQTLSRPSASVLLEIYRTAHINPNEVAYYSKLVEKLKGKYSRATIAKALVELEDLLLVVSQWEKTPASASRRWVRSYKLVNAAIPHVKKLAKILGINS